MKFMMLVKGDAAYEAGTPPPPELVAAIGKLGEEAARAGLVVAMGGLLPTSAGARIRVGGGALSVTDGPFAESKEIVGGYAIFDLPSREKAIAMGTEFMQVHADVLGPSYHGELEVRPLVGGPGDK
jgi:hypothetical protein